MNESDGLFHIGTRFYNTKEETEYPCNCLTGTDFQSHWMWNQGKKLTFTRPVTISWILNTVHNWTLTHPSPKCVLNKFKILLLVKEKTKRKQQLLRGINQKAQIGILLSCLASGCVKLFVLPTPSVPFQTLVSLKLWQYKSRRKGE